MKILLVNPLFDPEYPDGMPPLGIASIATAAKNVGHDVKILDLNLKHEIGTSVESSVSKSLKYDADVVGLTCWGNVTPFVIEFCKRFKSISAETKLVIGGEYASLRSEEVLRESGADFIVRGEGEGTFCHLMYQIEHAEDIGQVKGITYKQDQKIVSLPDRLLVDVDQLPFINWAIFDDLKQYKGYSKYKRLPFQASRGCPFKCIFCSVQRTWGGVQRKKHPKNIVNEIKYYIERFGLERLNIYDDVITLDKVWVSKICDLLIAEKIKIDWTILTRIDLVNKELLSLMRKAGCESIFYGVEHVSPEIQQLIGKTYKEDLVEKNIADTITAGIKAQVSVIFGWPVDTRKTVDQLSRFCRKMAKKGVSMIHMHMLFPLPGTRLTEEYSSFIVPNPYPKLTQPGLVKIPQEYYSLMTRHKEYVPDFWMFKSKEIEPCEVIRAYAETKLWIMEENLHRLSTLRRLGLIG